MKFRYLLLSLLVLVSFISGFALDQLMDFSSSMEKPSPALVSVEINGHIEIELPKESNKNTQLKTLLLSETDPKTVKTFEKLIRQQVATAHFQTVLRNPSMPLPLEKMQVSHKKSFFDASHNRIVVPYTLSGYIVAPDDSLLDSIYFDPNTDTYTEIFTVPADPTNLFQRLGYACANQEGIPIGQVDDANYGDYFDPLCAPGVKTCVDPQSKPLKPCLDVLQKENGVGTITVHFENIPYDESLAEKWKTNSDPTSIGIDLTVNKADLKSYDIVYKKFEQNSCAIQEKCVAGPGVRRLLRFDGSVKNVGDTDLSLGKIEDLKKTHQFEYNTCHQHNHFEGFAKYSLSKNGRTAISGRKQTFCVQGTDRFRNNETTSFTTSFNCEDQGLKAGWQDEYFKGLDCQWIDITDLPIANDTEDFELSMEVNPLKLICEGEPHANKYIPAVDGRAEKILDPHGNQILKQACKVNPELYKNNKSTVTVSIPKIGASVNQACSIVAFGAMRNCGWKMEELRTCKAGATIFLSQTKNDLVRACPDGVPCAYNEALVSINTKNARFTCPKEGAYLLMTAPFIAN